MILTCSAVQPPSTLRTKLCSQSPSPSPRSSPVGSSTRKPSTSVPSARISPLRNLRTFSSWTLVCTSTSGRTLPSAPLDPRKKRLLPTTVPKMWSLCSLSVQVKARFSVVPLRPPVVTWEMSILTTGFDVSGSVSVYWVMWRVTVAYWMALRTIQLIPCYNFLD